MHVSRLFDKEGQATLGLTIDHSQDMTADGFEDQTRWQCQTTRHSIPQWWPQCVCLAVVIQAVLEHLRYAGGVSTSLTDHRWCTGRIFPGVPMDQGTYAANEKYCCLIGDGGLGAGAKPVKSTQSLEPPAASASRPSTRHHRLDPPRAHAHRSCYCRGKEWLEAKQPSLLATGSGEGLGSGQYSGSTTPEISCSGKSQQWQARAICAVKRVKRSSLLSPLLASMMLSRGVTMQYTDGSAKRHRRYSSRYYLPTASSKPSMATSLPVPAVEVRRMHGRGKQPAKRAKHDSKVHSYGPAHVRARTCILANGIVPISCLTRDVTL
jgi:hypothetical protein